MENETIPTTTELVQMLLQSFTDNDGRDNFGFVIATYEKGLNGDYFVGAGISTDTGELTTKLTDALTNMFKDLQEPPKTNQERDDDNLGMN